MAEIIYLQKGRGNSRSLNELERADVPLQDEIGQSRSRHPAFTGLIDKVVDVVPIDMLPAEEFEPPTLTLVRNTSELHTPPVDTVE